MSSHNNERFAIAARLHTLLRRKTGRVTDIDWLAVNDDYATEIVRFARTYALAPDMEDLAEWANRLEQMVYATAEKHKAPPVPATTVQPVSTTTQVNHTDKKSYSTNSWARSVLTNVHKNPTFGQDTENDERYVGGLR